MNKRITIQDVASQAGVSITTVSRYLNGRYASMGKATRTRIGEVIDELGYRPNALAQGLKGNRTHIVAAVVVNTTYPFCVGFLRPLGNVLSRAGYHLFVCETGGDIQRERDIIESLLAQQVDAMVVQSDGHNNHLYGEIATTMPVVFADRGFDVPSAYHVTTNNYEASKRVTQHLIDSGYKQILYVTEDPEDVIPTRQHRLNGYTDACLEANLETWTIIVDKSNQATFQTVYDAIPSAEDKAALPMAIYTANGLLMVQLYHRLVHSGLNVPNQLGLATFDDPEWAQFVEPSLTCVRQPAVAMGEHTAKFLLELLERGAVLDDAKKQVVPSTLIIGGSTEIF